MGFACASFLRLLFVSKVVRELFQERTTMMVMMMRMTTVVVARCALLDLSNLLFCRVHCTLHFYTTPSVFTQKSVKSTC